MGRVGGARERVRRGAGRVGRGGGWDGGAVQEVGHEVQVIIRKYVVYDVISYSQVGSRLWLWGQFM